MSNNDTGTLKTNARELVKQYCVYDINARMTSMYEARADAVTGTPCMLTTYTYDGVSNRIVKRRESVGAWDSSYDI